MQHHPLQHSLRQHGPWLKPLARLLPMVLTLACGRDEGATEPTHPDGAATLSGVSVQSITSVPIDQAVIISTSLVASPSGRKHISYALFDQIGDGGVKYATCGSNCTVAANWHNLLVDAQGSRSSLKVGAAGRRHLVYGSSTGTLKYATCATTNCTAAADWQKLTVDPGRAGGGGVGRFPSLAFGPNGGLHVSHEGDGGMTTCTSAASWKNVVVDDTLFMRGATSLAVGSDGRRHISYLRYAYPDGNFAGDLRYATCLTNCGLAANWRKLTIDSSGIVGDWSSIAVSGDGRLHISYFDGTNSALKYATCAANCTVAANWQKITVDNFGNVGLYTSIAVGGDGRLHISHHDYTKVKRDLRYATCLTNCTNRANWQKLVLDATGEVGEFTSLALAGSVVNVSYYDRAGLVKYLEYSP
jgi:hypothetical protein